MSMLAAQRAMTRAFIDMDPTDITLTPYTATTTPGGGKTMTPGEARPCQRFKVIPMTFDQRPTVTAGGVERIIDYTLVGLWNAQGDVWDRFTLGDEDEYFVIVAIAPGHGYETKFLCERHRYQDKVV